MAAPPLNSGTMRPSNLAEDRPIVGFAFPFRKEAGEFPLRVRDADCISNNILTLFKTARRSRIMRPRMGTDAFDLVFESQGSLLTTRLDRSVRQTIKRDEPRASPISVRVVDTDRLTTTTVVYEVQGIRQALELEPFPKG